MILFYDIGTNNDIIENNLSNSAKKKDIIDNISLLTKYARGKNIKLLSSIDKEASIIDNEVIKEKTEVAALLNPLTIKLEEYNDIELKSALLDHNGDIFMEKVDKKITSNPNLIKILSFFSAEEIVLYGITSQEEILAASLALNNLGIRISIVEDALMPLNKLDVNIKKLLDEINQRGISLIKTKDLVSS